MKTAKRQPPSSKRPAHATSAAPEHTGKLSAATIAFAIFTFVITAIAFLPALRNGFVGWDDTGMFLENVDYRGLAWPNIKWMFTTFHYAHYQPLTWLTLGLDYKLWGMNAKGYHLTSLIIHSINAVCLFFVLQLLVTLCKRLHTTTGAGMISRSETKDFLTPLLCTFGALFWAIHPLRVESVAWATERRDVLCGFFVLLTVFTYLKAQSHSKPNYRWLVASYLLFACSLLSKTLGMTLPIILLLLDVYPLRRVFAPRRRDGPQHVSLSKVVLEKVPYFLLSGALAVVAFKGQQRFGIEAEQLTLLKRLAISAYGFCFYVWKTVLPINLSPLYLLPPELNPFAAKYLGCAAILIVITGTLLLLRKKWTALFIAWCAYGILVGPVIGLTHKGDQIAADRYTYLCVIPFSALIAGLSLLLQRRPASRLPVTALVATSAIGMGVLTFSQTKIWKDDLSLWEQALRVEPNNAIAHNGRGRISMERGQFDAALADFNQAIRLNPKIVSARNNRGMVLYQKGDLEGALADFDAAIKIHPEYQIFNNTGAIREVRGDLDGALSDYSKALQMNPRHSIAYFNRARIKKQKGDLAGALADYNSAIASDPLYADAYYRRGNLQRERGNAAAALQDYSNALKVAPAGWADRANAERLIRELSQQQ